MLNGGKSVRRARAVGSLPKSLRLSHELLLGFAKCDQLLFPPQSRTGDGRDCGLLSERILLGLNLKCEVNYSSVLSCLVELSCGSRTSLALCYFAAYLIML